MSSNGLASLMRTLTLATVGIVAFGVDVVSEFAHTSMTRGAQIEASAQELMERYQENAKIQARTAAVSRSNLLHQASVTLDENLNALWRVFVVVDAKATPEAVPALVPSVEPKDRI